MRVKSLAVLSCLVSATLASSASCGNDPATRPAQRPIAPGSTMAGLSVFRDIGDAALGRALDALVAQGVGTVVAESEVRGWVRDPAPDEALMARVADAAHARGLSVAWSIPSLAVTTPGAAITKQSLGIAHPDWLQIPPALVEDEDDEIAWLCPTGPARADLLARVQRFAATGIDGLVVDAPELVPARGPEPFACPELKAAFAAKHGVEAPPRVDCAHEDAPIGACVAVWKDPAWGAWIRYRHEVLAELEGEIARVARAANPSIDVLVRTRTLDHNLATELGHDATFSPRVPGLRHLWDATPPSGAEGMRRALADDWIHRKTVTKLGRAIDRDGATWAVTHGDREWDAEAAMAIALSSQASPLEVRTPYLSVSASTDLRTRAFAWIRAHAEPLFSSTSLARVAIVHAPAARDAIDFGHGPGLWSFREPPLVGFSGAVTSAPDPTWWTDSADDAVDELEVVGELRGVAKALSHLGVPYAIEPLERGTADDLRRYDVVFAPSVAALSDAQAAALRGYVEAGGTLVSTGLSQAALDELGRPRPELAIADVLGFGATTRPPSEATLERAFGAGQVVHAQALLGRRYLRYEDPRALAFVRSALARERVPSMLREPRPGILVDRYALGDAEQVVHVINLVGADGSGLEPTAEEEVELVLDVPRNVERITVSQFPSTEPDQELPFASGADPAQVIVKVRVRRYALLRVKLGAEAVAPSSVVSGPPTVAKLSDLEGFAGHSVVLEGSGFGFAQGTVRYGERPCKVTAWRPDRIVVSVPDDAPVGDSSLVVEAATGVTAPVAFSVRPSTLVPTPAMTNAYTFVRQKMRSPFGGIFSNYVDHPPEPGDEGVYPYGHHQTAEHLGLMLWVAAAMIDHAAFEDAYTFLEQRMVSPRRDVVNWAVDKDTAVPLLSSDRPDEPPVNSNAPLDDFRVVRGLVAGYMQWKDERYLWMARRIGQGLFRSSIGRSLEMPEFPDGIVAYAYNWPELGGTGRVDLEVIPIDYADLWTMTWLSTWDARWKGTIQSSIALMERASIPESGQFWNSYLPATKTLSGDFEYRDTIAGQKIKTIQSLWIAIHLARVGRKDAAKKALDFYKAQYLTKGRIAEYLEPNGQDCIEPHFDETRKGGEARIYAQVARLAFHLGDKAFADELIAKKILAEQVVDPASPIYGSIGMSIYGDGDAEAWNTLESLLTLALQQGSPVVAASFAL